MGDGGEADRRREVPGGPAGVDREIRHRLRRLHLVGFHQDHPQEEDGGEERQDEAEDGEDLLHGVSKDQLS